MCNYFDVKQANEMARQARAQLERSIKAKRAYNEGCKALDKQIQADIVKYRLTSRRARKMVREYLDSCLVA